MCALAGLGNIHMQMQKNKITPIENAKRDKVMILFSEPKDKCNILWQKKQLFVIGIN